MRSVCGTIENVAHIVCAAYWRHRIRMSCFGGYYIMGGGDFYGQQENDSEE